MRKKSEKKFFFWIFTVLFAVTLCDGQPTPELYWNMDNINGVELCPTIGNCTVWLARLNVSGFGDVFLSNFTSTEMAEIIDGYKGNALLVEDVDMRVGIPFNTGCLFDIASCEGGGITVAFWMFVRSWKNVISSPIQSSVHYDLLQPGFAFYEDLINLGAFRAEVILTNNSIYSASFNRTEIENNWNHVTMTWSQQEGIKLYVNGSEVSYIQPPRTEIQTISNYFVSFLNFGSDSINVILDDVAIWYRALSAEEIFLILCPTTTTAPDTFGTQTIPGTTLMSDTIATTTNEIENQTTLETDQTTDESPSQTTVATTNQGTIETLTETTLAMFNGSETDTISQTTNLTVDQTINPTTNSMTNFTASENTNLQPNPATTGDYSTTTTSDEYDLGFDLNSWRVHTVIVLSLGAVISMFACMTSVCVFCFLLCLTRKRKKRRKRHFENSQSILYQ